MTTKLLSSSRPAAKSNRFQFKIQSFFAAVLLISGLAANAQVNAYTFSATTGNPAGAGSFPQFAIINPPVAPLQAITWPATASAVTWDDDVPQLINFGFTFNFNGVNYTNAYISPNGFLTFGSAAAANNYDPIASNDTYQDAIALWANNFRSNNVAVKYLLSGTAPNQKLTIEWVGFRNSTSAGTMYAQLILNESAAGNPRAGYIDMLYKNVAGASAVSPSDGQIGFRGVNNTDFKTLNFTLNSGWGPSGAAIPNANFTVSTNGTGTATNADRVRINGNAHTGTLSGRWFTFTPPTCFAPRTVAAVPQLGGTTVNLSWPVVATATSGYDYYITQTPPTNTGSLPSAATTPTGSTATAAANTAVAGGLLAGAQYYVYVRSKCGAAGGWSAAFPFTTLCSVSGVPYIEDFNGTAGIAPPACSVVDTNPNAYTNAAAGQGSWISSGIVGPTPTEAAFNTRHMRIQSPFNASPVPPANDSWWITKGVNMVAGTSYKLTYTYGSGSQFPATSQELSVWYGMGQDQFSMSDQLANHSILRDGPYTNVVNFTVPTSGIYYFGFYDGTAGNMAITLLDDVKLELSTCFPPAINPTPVLANGTATVNWTAATPAPGVGYEYYYVPSTAYNPPTSSSAINGTTPTGTNTTTLTGLTGGVTYYVWVRSNCGGNDYSGWAGPISFTAIGPTPATCNPSGAGFFQDPQGITNVTFNNINNTTGLETNNYGDYAYLTGYAAIGSTLTVNTTYRTGFTYDTAIWVDWNRNGSFEAGELMASGSSPTGTPSLMSLSFTVGGTVGQSYRMRIGGIDSPIFTGGALTPCRTGAYQAFEDYTLQVTAPPPALALASTSVSVCAGSATPAVMLTTPVANYASYTWTPAPGVSGNATTGWTFNPATTTVYTLEGANGAPNYTRRTTTITVIVNPAPSAVTVSPATATVCQNATTGVALTASGGLISNQTIYAESFNGAAPGWLVTNTTTPAGPGADAAAWGLYPDASAPFANAIHSNDNSQFALANSDAPGLGSNTFTTLTSPSISLAGYNTATLSFWEFYQMYIGESNDEYGRVEIRIMPAGAWTTLLNHDGTANVGTYNNWVNQNIVLGPAYLNQNVQVRFTYSGSWDWGWGIDNFRIFGDAPTNYTWAPTTGLYTTAALTTAYTGGNAATVYAAPTSNQNYVATATFGLCPTSSTATAVTVTPISGGTLAATSQVACGIPSDITLTGVAGTILYWESATNAAFTVGVATVAGSAGQNPLLGTTIGAVGATRYFRAVVSVGGCANAFSPVHTINVNSATWNGTAWSPAAPTAGTSVIFTGNYTVAANATYCAVTVNNGATVTVNAGVTLTVTNAVTVSTATTPANSNLVFLNGASLIQTTNAVNSGDIKYYRTTTPMRAYDFTYWSSPVSAQIVGKVSPLTLSDKYFWFNTSTYQWTAVTAPGTTVMTPGRGYIIRAPQGFPTTPQLFTTHFGFDDVVHGGGTPNNGDIVLPVTRNATPANNLDCIGNPYPSALSANLLMGDSSNASVLGNGTTLYFWTHNTPVTALNYSPNDYASYNYTGGVGTGTIAGNNGCPTCNNAVPDGNIAAGQGFMVTLKASGNITFRNSMRLGTVGANSQFFKMPNVVDAIENLERHRFWLELTNETGMFKQTLVGYVEGATNSIDEGYDGPTIEAGNPVSLYSLTDNNKLTSQGRALPFLSTDVVPLGYRANAAGTFTITQADKDGLFANGQDVYLEDKASGFLHNLSIAPYTFATEAGTFDDRFEIRYMASGALATQVAAFSEDAVVVYKNRKDIHVETSHVIIKEVRVFDLRGREITRQEQVNATQTVLNVDAAQQVLLVQVTSTDNRVVTKKIVF